MNQRTKHFYIWIGLIIAVVVVCLLSLMKISDFKRSEDVSLMESAFNKVKKVFQSENAILTYQSKDNAFSFQYPGKLKLIEKDNRVILNHSVLFENHGPCDMVGDTKIYKYLDDFNVTFQILGGNVKQAVKQLSPYMPEENFTKDSLKISTGFINEYKFGNLSGFSIYEGAEGCGHVIYYFPIKDNQTLIVEKAMIQALSPVIVKEERDKVLKVPGVITPEESEQIFEKILKSLKVSPSPVSSPAGGEEGVASWKTYRNEEYGFEIKYPNNWEFVEFKEENVGFGMPADNLRGDRWGIYFHDGTKYALENIIGINGNQFSDREENRENITVNNIPALKVVITTPSYPNWQDELVFIQKNNIIFEITNGAVKNPLFEPFYKSFKFIEFLDKTSSLLKACPEEWYEDQMPKLLSNINREYFIYNGIRREASEFDIDWVMKNCNIKKQVVF